MNQDLLNLGANTPVTHTQQGAAGSHPDFSCPNARIGEQSADLFHRPAFGHTSGL